MALIKSGNKLFSMGVGDSRIILHSDGDVSELSVTHKPDDIE